jgi:hypothetical protein
VNGDFKELTHSVEPRRMKWQRFPGAAFGPLVENAQAT